MGNVGLEVISSVSNTVVDPFIEKRTLLALGNPNSLYNTKHVVSIAIRAGTAESDEPIYAEVQRRLGFV